MTFPSILAVLLLAVGTLANAQQSDVTLASLTCTGIAVTGLDAKYGYNLTLVNTTIPSTCADVNIRISKVFLDGACASKRDNSFSCVSVSQTDRGRGPNLQLHKLQRRTSLISKVSEVYFVLVCFVFIYTSLSARPHCKCAAPAE